MKITYLGTGAAEGVPAIFCRCEYCNAVRKSGKGIRTRSQVLIGGALSIDFPPDAFWHAYNSGADFSAIEHLLVTHSHMDHFYAHDFVLRGYKYAYSPTASVLNIYGNREVGDVFEESTRRELRDDVKKGLKVHTVSAFIPFQAGACTVVALPATHSSCEPFVYLVEKENKRYLHLTDTGILGEEAMVYLTGKRVNLVTLDCTFLWQASEEVRRHMGVEDNEKLLSKLREVGAVDDKTKIVLTHFSHHSKPSEEALKRAEERLGAICAYDGMSIEI